MFLEFHAKAILDFSVGMWENRTDISSITKFKSIFQGSKQPLIKLRYGLIYKVNLFLNSCSLVTLIRTRTLIYLHMYKRICFYKLVFLYR